MSRSKYSAAYLALEAKLSELTESADETFLENGLDGYSYVFDDDRDAILKNFRENYRSSRIGFQAFDHLTGDEIADAALKVMSVEAFTDLLLSHSEATDCDYYVQWNEIGSVSIGEYEHQIDTAGDDELIALVAACTQEELKMLRYQDWSRGKSVVAGSFWTYGHPCDRIVWKVDPETLLEALEAPLRQAGLTDPDDKVQAKA